MRPSRSNGFRVSNPNRHHHRPLPPRLVTHGAVPVRHNNSRVTYVDEVAILDLCRYSEVTISHNPQRNIESGHHGLRFQRVQQQDSNPYLRFTSSTSTSEFSRSSETLNRTQQVRITQSESRFVPNRSFEAYQRSQQQSYRRIHSTLLLQLENIAAWSSRAVQNRIHQQRSMQLLDVDRMPYEELLDLGESIGNITTGLSKEAIPSHLKTRVHHCVNEEPNTCIVCQEEYENQERIGTLSCGHEYHVDCITKWLMLKNFCPICKRQSQTVT